MPKALVELRDLGQSLDAIVAAVLGDDRVIAFVEIVFILDVADDLLEDVLDRDQAGHAAVFVHDHRDVVAVGAEVAQQHVERLALRDEDRRPQAGADVEVGFGVVAQQVLREKDADHVVAAAIDDREPGMRSLDNERDPLRRRL